MKDKDNEGQHSLVKGKSGLVAETPESIRSKPKPITNQLESLEAKPQPMVKQPKSKIPQPQPIMGQPESTGSQSDSIAKQFKTKEPYKSKKSLPESNGQQSHKREISKSISSLPKSIEELQGFAKSRLQDLWRRYFKNSSSMSYPKMSFTRIIQTLWYKIQCERFGLKIEQKHLTKLNRYSEDPEKFVKKSFKAKYLIRNGTEIVKSFKGREYRVQAASQDEFIYDGQSYKTLSAVAKVICGKKVSGYDFFGLNNNNLKTSSDKKSGEI